MSACPNGHQSNDPEWCDTCGAPLQGGTGAAAGTVAPPASTPNSMPNSMANSTPSSVPSAGGVTVCTSCGESNPESNLFCESCGLDFVTGQLPPPVVAPVTPAADPTGSGSGPTGILAPAAPVDLGTDLGWTATSTVDTDWFAAKGEGIGSPPDRVPNVVSLRHANVLVGRTRSSGANPGVTIDDDHGISRKHAEFNYDAANNSWSVTDLGSTNGTFVVPADASLTADLAPIAPNVPVALTPTDRVFVGAWTRLDLTSTAGSAVATGSVAAADPDPIDPVAIPDPDPIVSPDPDSAQP
jgi:FHA domain